MSDASWDIYNPIPDDSSTFAKSSVDRDSLTETEALAPNDQFKQPSPRNSQDERSKKKRKILKTWDIPSDGDTMDEIENIWSNCNKSSNSQQKKKRRVLDISQCHSDGDTLDQVKEIFNNCDKSTSKQKKKRKILKTWDIPSDGDTMDEIENIWSNCNKSSNSQQKKKRRVLDISQCHSDGDTLDQVKEIFNNCDKSTSKQKKKRNFFEMSDLTSDDEDLNLLREKFGECEKSISDEVKKRNLFEISHFSSGDEDLNLLREKFREGEKLLGGKDKKRNLFEISDFDSDNEDLKLLEEHFQKDEKSCDKKTRNFFEISDLNSMDDDLNLLSKNTDECSVVSVRSFYVDTIQSTEHVTKSSCNSKIVESESNVSSNTETVVLEVEELKETNTSKHEGESDVIREPPSPSVEDPTAHSISADVPSQVSSQQENLIFDAHQSVDEDKTLIAPDAEEHISKNVDDGTVLSVRSFYVDTIHSTEHVTGSFRSNRIVESESNISSKIETVVSEVEETKGTDCSKHEGESENAGTTRSESSPAKDPTAHHISADVPSQVSSQQENLIFDAHQSVDEDKTLIAPDAEEHISKNVDDGTVLSVRSFYVDTIHSTEHVTGSFRSNRIVESESNISSKIETVVSEVEETKETDCSKHEGESENAGTTRSESSPAKDPTAHHISADVPNYTSPQRGNLMSETYLVVKDDKTLLAADAGEQTNKNVDDGTVFSVRSFYVDTIHTTEHVTETSHNDVIIESESNISSKMETVALEVKETERADSSKHGEESGKITRPESPSVKDPTPHSISPDQPNQISLRENLISETYQIVNVNKILPAPDAEEQISKNGDTDLDFLIRSSYVDTIHIPEHVTEFSRNNVIVESESSKIEPVAQVEEMEADSSGEPEVTRITPSECPSARDPNAHSISPDAPSQISSQRENPPYSDHSIFPDVSSQISQPKNPPHSAHSTSSDIPSQISQPENPPYSLRSRNSLTSSSSNTQTLASKSSTSVISKSKIVRPPSKPFKVPPLPPPKKKPKRRTKAGDGGRWKPVFPKFDYYCNKRFYDYLISKMISKYGIKTNVKVVKLMEYIHSTVDAVIKDKTGDHHELVEEMKKVLFRANVVTTHFDFYMSFCFDYMPIWFRNKAIPMLVPKGQPPNVKFDLELLFESIE